jgi:hypothetical protein
MKGQFHTLYRAMSIALDERGCLELRAQRALLALLENRLADQERQFWLFRAESHMVVSTEGA